MPAKEKSKSQSKASAVPREVNPMESTEAMSQLGTFGGESVASSAAFTNRTERLAALFPLGDTRFGSFQKDSKLLDLFLALLKLDSSFIARLENCGFVTPAIIVNRFGLGMSYIAKSFAMMGPSYVLDQQNIQQSTNLVIFARSIITGFAFDKPKNKSWKQCKKSHSFNTALEQWDEASFSNMQDALTDPDVIQLASILMRNVRAQIRKWIRGTDPPPTPSIQSETTTPQSKQQPATVRSPVPVPTVPQVPITPQQTSVPASNETPLQSIAKTFNDMEKRLSAEIGSIRTQLDNVKSAVKQEVQTEVGNRLQNTIESRAKTAVKQQLGKLFNKTESQQPVTTVTAAGAPDGDPGDDSESQDSSDSNRDIPKQANGQGDDNQKNPDGEVQGQADRTYPVVIPELPKTHHKKGRNQRSSFYIKRASFSVLKSSLDVNYKYGCNDEIFSKSDSTVSLNTEEREKRNKSKEWFKKLREDSQAKNAPVCKNTTPLKRASLPSTVLWNGRSGKDLEKFIDKVTGHVAQQAHMGYLLLEPIAHLWLKYGDAEAVLQIGMSKKIHPSLHHISPTQFVLDVVWLYGALQASIVERGRSIIREHEDSQDGILTWKRFVDTYRYDGDVDVYLSEQQRSLCVQFHSHYPGGMLKFLEDYETAFLNIEYVL